MIIEKSDDKNKFYTKIAFAFLFATVLSFCAGFLYGAVKDSALFNKLGFAPFDFVALVVVVVAVVFIFYYLKPSKNFRMLGSQYSKDAVPEELDDHRDRISLLEDRLDDLLSGIEDLDVSFLLQGDDKQELKKILLKKLEEGSQASLLEDIENKVTDNWHIRQAEDVYSKTVDRLEMEIFDQARRGNVNLVLGMLATMAGVAILSYSVFQAPAVESYMGLISHFLPNLSLVILIEVFAYFFLRLYKQSLSEIKYFQNEITNIESKYLALNVSLSCRIDEGLIKVVEKLLMTERNFLLDKGQSTVELERIKMEQRNNVNFVEKLSNIIESVKKS